MKTQIIDLNIIKQFDELQMDGMPDILNETIDSFLKTSPSRIKKLKDALIRNESQTAALEAHALKSSSRMLGAVELSDLLEKIEESARKSSLHMLSNCGSILEELFQSSCLALQKIKANREPKVP